MTPRSLAPLVLFASFVGLAACAASQEDPGPPVRPDEETFRRQWYERGAEITRYRLEQSRYGEVRDGDAVLVFVTEPFDPEAQVKADDPDQADAVPVLKLNHTRKFLTGIYPYSTMTSIFQPHDGDRLPRVLKTTTSVQEWCGQVFAQYNRREDGWRLRSFSYFQSEGDRDAELPDAWLEEELWTRLRCDPASLPTGEVTIVPGNLFCRFRHVEPRPLPARAALGIDDEGDRTYTVTWPELDRQLRITFAAEFPFAIESWEERVGDDVTTATATHRIHSLYWRRNGRAHESLRRDLGLE